MRLKMENKEETNIDVAIKHIKLAVNDELQKNRMDFPYVRLLVRVVERLKKDVRVGEVEEHVDELDGDLDDSDLDGAMRGPTPYYGTAGANNVTLGGFNPPANQNDRLMAIVSAGLDMYMKKQLTGIEERRAKHLFDLADRVKEAKPEMAKGLRDRAEKVLQSYLEGAQNEDLFSDVLRGSGAGEVSKQGPMLPSDKEAEHGRDRDPEEDAEEIQGGGGEEGSPQEVCPSSQSDQST
jgi:hypothetical protein